MGDIARLDSNSINQIAAGEVIERPFSVVKELVENAIDAQASQITITLENGGKKLIEVLDNGIGMDQADALLCLERHATSKLKSSTALSQITTLGFRGEALAAIASVCELQLLTRIANSDAAIHVTTAHGQPPTHKLAALPRGTQISITDLFQNIPARLKFLRNDSTEYQHIAQHVTQLAIAHPQIHFKVLHNKKTTHDFQKAANLEERLVQIFGAKLKTQLIPIQINEPGLKLEGLISHPNHSFNTRRWQYLFINQRSVRNIQIQHGVMQGYRTLLMHGRQPAYFLLLNLLTDDVDVNVHPTKSEVRLRNAQYVHSVLSVGIEKNLRETTRADAYKPSPDGLPSTSTQVGDYQTQYQAGWEGSPPAPSPIPTLHSQQGTVPFAPAGLTGISTAGNAPSTEPSDNAENPFHFQPMVENITSLEPMLKPMMGSNISRVSSETNLQDATTIPAPLIPNSVNPDAAPQPREDNAPLPGLRTHTSIIGQFNLTYILLQQQLPDRTNLVLIDQHAAHERIMFEHYRQQFYGDGIQTEAFLLPITLDLSPQNALLLEQHLSHWKTLGFHFEGFGSNCYLLREAPVLLKGRDIAQFVLEVLDELALFGKAGRPEEVFNDILERMACHSAIRAGMRLDNHTIEQLLAQLETLDINLYCPHGRPVRIDVPVPTIEKWFKRVV